MNWTEPESTTIEHGGNEYSLVLTCRWCPEQYDVYLGERQVGYLRLRGIFSAECPSAEALPDPEEVYESDPQGYGQFETAVERERELNAAIAAVHEWVLSNP